MMMQKLGNIENHYTSWESGTVGLCIREAESKPFRVHLDVILAVQRNRLFAFVVVLACYVHIDDMLSTLPFPRLDVQTCKVSRSSLDLQSYSQPVVASCWFFLAHV
ncbi:hypothetical protein NX059_009453 [Plenodomus lindquistii]|nr:hypothetical protein NX059_009453 [Plenodomus lindquistii]